MGFTTNTSTDNKYKVGTHIFAKANPGQKLQIIRYYQRIYYCAQIENPGWPQLAYFERELIPTGITANPILSPY
jgi:hypothetical protein